MTNANDPAIPGTAECSTGLTKREYMATQLMAGMVSVRPLEDIDWEVLAKYATNGTDALINALNEKGENS